MVFCLGRGGGVVWCNVVLTFVFGFLGGRGFFCCVACCFLTSRPLFQGKDYMHQLEEIINVLGTPSDESLAFITNSMAKRAIMQVCAGGRGGAVAWFLCGGVVVDFFVVLFFVFFFGKMDPFFPASQKTTKTVFRIVSGVQ